MSAARPSRALLALAGLALVAVVAAAAGPQTTKYVPTDKTTCWNCHRDWSPPLRAFAVAIPPAQASAAVGSAFDYQVQIQNTWLEDIPGLSPALDLRDAPSLRFVASHAPDHNQTLVTIATNAGNLTSPQAAGTSFYVPAGATTLTFAAQPHNKDASSGPDLQLVIHPPTGAPLPAVDARGRGQPENVTLGVDTLSQYASGVWGVTVRFVPVESPPSLPPKPPVLGAQDVDVAEDARFETQGLRILARPLAEFIGKQASSLATWRLEVAALPQPGEKVRIFTNVTAHYKHNAAEPGGDWTNATTITEVPLGIADGNLTLVHTQAIEAVALQNGPTASTISEAVGYAAAFLLVSSIWSGGMFGRASRRSLNRVFGTAKRRVAFHNFLSYGLTVAALVHMAIFLLRISKDYQITLGLIWGGLAIGAMVGLGFTGALQVPMIRKWNYATWRWSHYGMTVAALVFTLLHLALDGRNFGFVQQVVGWKDPFYHIEVPA